MSVARRDIGVFIIGLLVGATGVRPLTHAAYWLIIVGLSVALYLRF